jgi:hypothetical protein
MMSVNFDRQGVALEIAEPFALGLDLSAVTPVT